MTWIPVADATLEEWPKGTEVMVFFRGVLDGYVDHAGNRQVIVSFPMAEGIGQGTVMVPPNAEIEKWTFDPKATCSCSPGHKTKMARYGQPHARRCPLRSTT